MTGIQNPAMQGMINRVAALGERHNFCLSDNEDDALTSFHSDLPSLRAQNQRQTLSRARVSCYDKHVQRMVLAQQASKGHHSISRATQDDDLMQSHNASADNTLRLDVEEHGELLIMRYIGPLDAAAFERDVLPVWIEKIRQSETPRRTLNDFRLAKPRGIKVIELIASNAQTNRPFIRRGAVLGVNRRVIRFLYDRYVALSGRRDHRLFDDEAEARAWLMQND